MQSLADIAAERQRQIQTYGLQHDDTVHRGGLAYAASLFALDAATTIAPNDDAIIASTHIQPLSPCAHSPSDARRNLIKAAACCAAEIDRIDRRRFLSQGNPALYGEPFEGGFYAGRFPLRGQMHALILASNAEGLLVNGQWATNAAWDKSIPGAQSLIDGFANTEALNDADHPAAQWARSQRIAGKDDWFLMARDQLELAYRNLKPGTRNNYTYANRAEFWGIEPGKYNGLDTNGNGFNPSVPTSEAYTAESPSQTLTEPFQSGGPEAFDEAWYGSSTEFSPNNAWAQNFGDGNQNNNNKNNRLSFRVARK